MDPELNAPALSFVKDVNTGFPQVEVGPSPPPGVICQGHFDASLRCVHLQRPAPVAVKAEHAPDTHRDFGATSQRNRGKLLFWQTSRDKRQQAEKNQGLSHGNP